MRILDKARSVYWIFSSFSSNRRENNNKKYHRLSMPPQSKYTVHLESRSYKNQSGSGSWCKKNLGHKGKICRWNIPKNGQCRNLFKMYQLLKWMVEPVYRAGKTIFLKRSVAIPGFQFEWIFT